MKIISRIEGDCYYALIPEPGKEACNIAAVYYRNHRKVRIGPEGEGQPAPGGITTGNPEDVRWFAQKLLHLADVLEHELSSGEDRTR